MKIHVLIDQNGQVVGTTPVPNKKGQKGQDGVVFAGATPANNSEHKVFEINVTPEMKFNPEKGDLKAVHKRLGDFIKSKPKLRPLPEMAKRVLK